MRFERKVGAAAAAAVLAGALLLAPAVEGRAAGDGDLLAAGEKAPPIVGVDIDGKPFSLEEELARGPVFLVFWSIF